MTEQDINRYEQGVRLYDRINLLNDILKGDIQYIKVFSRTKNDGDISICIDLNEEDLDYITNMIFADLSICKNQFEKL